ncbi:hypothetical protein Tco_0770068, partial [Tanacetum coccineum]
EIFPIVNQVDARVQIFKIQFLKEAAKFVRDFQSLAKEADESLAKHKALELEIERLLRAVVRQDIMAIVQNQSVSKQKDTNKGTSVNTQFSKQLILGKPPSSSYKPKLYYVTPFPKSSILPKVDKTNALSKLVTLNSAPSSRESNVMNNERVIALGIFKINPFKSSRVSNFVPNKHVKASVRTKPITVSQPHVTTKNDVLFKSESSFLLNKLEKIEDNYRSLQSSNYPDHTSSEYNNIKVPIRNEKSKVICVTCKQCLVTANHDDCVLQYVNGMKSRKKIQSANVSKSENQKKYKTRVWKPKKVGSKERLASPKPSTPRSCLRWLPTRRMFNPKGKITATSESECQPNCSKGDNACTSNPQEPINKRTKKIMETMNMTLDELSAMAFVHFSA